jgi:hypothetical protein
MKKLLILPLLGALAACATPRESCINNVHSQIRTIEQAITKTESDINRGYAVHVTRESYTSLTRCTDAQGHHYPCERTRYTTKEQPVSIDIDAEQRKLERLTDRLTALHLTRSQQIAQCRAIHPE